MVELIKEVKKPKPPKGEAKKLAFIMKNQDQDLLEHIFTPFPYANTK